MFTINYFLELISYIMWRFMWWWWRMVMFTYRYCYNKRTFFYIFWNNMVKSNWAYARLLAYKSLNNTISNFMQICFFFLRHSSERAQLGRTIKHSSTASD